VMAPVERLGSVRQGEADLADSLVVHEKSVRRIKAGKKDEQFLNRKN